MKVERLELEKDFKPIKISLTIETKEEFGALREMCAYNMTISNLVKGRSKEITTFLVELLNKINK